MKPQDYPAAFALAAVLFGTSGLGLVLWLALVVPLCTLAWLAWTVVSTPSEPHRRAGRHLPSVRFPHL